jgi:hypothetical protein
MKRFLIVGVALVVVLIAAAGVFVLTNLDSIIKTAVEKVGSDVTQVDVRLNKVNIGLKEGSGELYGLSVGNPVGFEADSVFELGKIRLVLDTESLTSDIIVIRELVILEPVVTYEFTTKGSNIQALQSNVKKSSGAKSGEAASKDDASEGGGKKLVIERLSIEGGQVNVVSSLLKKPLQVSLAKVELHNIGKEKGGLGASELAALLMNVLSKSALKSVDSLDLGKLVDISGSAKEAVENVVSDAMEGEGIRQGKETLKKLFK